MNTNNNWQDQYINRSEGEYICYDERGEYIESAVTLNIARKIIEEYTQKHNKNYLDVL